MENAGTSFDLSPDAIREEYKEEIDELRQHMNFNTHNLSDDFVNDMFRRYVERHISVDTQEKAPVCPFETCGECDTAYSDSCYTCKFAEESFQKILDDIYKKADLRTKARVLCIGCGAQKRTLRKWHKSYLCTDCYNIMMNIGEEKYIKALRGE